MADPGREWPATHHYREHVANEWLRAQGWPVVTVVSLASEAPFRPRAQHSEHGTLLDECLRIKALPSIAYGYKKCSLKYKARPANWYLERQAWALAAWKRGERITRAIGYDASEERRVRDARLDPVEARRFVPRYPLVDSGLDREACEDLIAREGLPLPHKSACMWCPSNTLNEWIELRDQHPRVYAEALAMSRNADTESPDVVGLMRCNRPGQRQLHLYVWNDAAPRRCDPDDDREGLPCECAL